ncbi:hypothetical protein [Nostoc sp. WHI]|uniref:hypothetical protein n=1 Tax=Nostoc sp. WHI TaxID=2650611 RepID=UPI0018C80362|nr:hypothetical protein [Nostoc sp. WHI]MBG1267251.1 helix-turn-helix domain-containing protein [Nostoc sp. WHI]
MNITDLSKIGIELIEASKEVERKPGEVLQEIFPFVYEASRRMSAREISKWLQDKYDIQISQPTLSRALKDPKQFWDGYTETIEPVARRIASSLGINIKSVLFNLGQEDDMAFHEAMQDAKHKLSKSELKDVEDGLVFLREKWFVLSDGTRRDCSPFFDEAQEDPTWESISF